MARLSANRNDFALVVLLGLRIFEACGASIADLGEEYEHRVLRVRGKGSKGVLVPVPPAVAPGMPRTAHSILPMSAGALSIDVECFSHRSVVGCQAGRVSHHPADDEDEGLPPTLREQGIIALPVHNTGLAGPLPADPQLAENLSPQGRQRWLLANRLAAELADPPSATRVQGHDLLSAHVISMGLDEVPAVGLAVHYAVLAPRRFPGSTIIGEGTGGSVVRLHGPLYSVVFRFHPELAPVLVLVDTMPDVAVRVDLDENPRARLEIMQMTMGILVNMQEPGTGEIRARL